MANDNNRVLGIIIMGFVALLLGTVLVQQVGDDVEGNTELSSITNETLTVSITEVVNESITITSLSGATENDNVIRVGFFGNGTNSTHLDDVNIGAEVNFTRNGSIIVSTLHFPVDGIYNISYATSTGTGQTSQDDVVSISFFGNATFNTNTDGIEVGDEVNFTKAGAITVSLENFTSSDHNISYQYEGDLYVTDSTSRTFLKLVPLFFVLAIIIIAFIMFKDAFPEFLGGKP